jgi:hypothetical protein
MSKIESAGRYPATVTAANFGETENGTPYLYLALAIESGASISAWLYLTEKALEGTTKTLRDAFGFDGNFETACDQVVGKKCSITVESEEYNGKESLKVKWINALRVVNPIKDQSTFLKTLTLKAARIPAKASPGAAPTRAPQAAPVGNRAVGQAKPQPTAGSGNVDEDVPF